MSYIMIDSEGEFRVGVLVRITTLFAECLQIAGCSRDFIARYREPHPIVAVWTNATGDWVSLERDDGSFLMPELTEVVASSPSPS